MDSSETVLFDLEDTLIQTPWSDPRQVTTFRQKTRQMLIDLGLAFIRVDELDANLILSFLFCFLHPYHLCPELDHLLRSL